MTVIQTIKSLIGNYELSVSAIGIYSLKIISLMISYGVSITLARILLIEQYGYFVLILSWLSIFVVISVFGMDNLIVRELSKVNQDNWELKNKLHKKVYRRVLSVSVMLAVAGVLVSWIFYSFGLFDSYILLALLFASISLPFLALVQLFQGELLGLNVPILSRVPNMIIFPTSFIVLIFIFSSWFPLDISTLFLVRFLALGLTFILSAVILSFNGLKTTGNIIQAKKASGDKLNSFPFFMISISTIINTQISIMLLGLIVDAATTGLYDVAFRGVSLISFLFISIALTIAPRIARHYARNEIDQLVTIAKLARWLALIAGVFTVIGFIVFGQLFLNLFGAEFVVAYPTLVILCLGELIKAVLVYASPCLDMAGHENISAIGVAASALVNLVFGIIFIYSFGLIGAAISRVLGTLVQQVVLAVGVKRKLGLNIWLKAV